MKCHCLHTCGSLCIVRLLCLNLHQSASHDFVLFAPWSYLLFLCAAFFLSRHFRGEIICALINVCASESSLCACSACWSGQMVRLVWSWGDWDTLSRADGKEWFCTGRGRIKAPASLSSLSPLSLCRSLSQLLFPSVSTSFLSFTDSISHNWTWQCFRDWVVWVNGELPASPKSWVCMCGIIEER